MFFKNPLYDDGSFNIHEFDFEKAFKNIKPISVDKVKYGNMEGGIQLILL